MTDWKEFRPNINDFKSDSDYKKYRENCKCGVCHKKLEIGDLFDLRPIQTPEQSGSLTVQAVVVHKKCVDEK